MRAPGSSRGRRGGPRRRETRSAPVAWVTLRAGAPPDKSALRARLRRAPRAIQATPVAFRFAAALPRNVSGKLLRRELREREQQLAAAN